MKTTTPTPGSFTWYDFNSADIGPARRFYTELMGWGQEQWGPAEGGYPMFTLGGMPIGGYRQLPPEAVEGGCPNAWLAYVTVSDVDATVARAVQAGGRTHVPATDIPQVGRFAVLRDPLGAHLAVFKGLDESPTIPHMDEPGMFSWHELATSDLEAAFTFYRDVLAWKVAHDMDMGEDMGLYRIFHSSGDALGGMYRAPEGAPQGWLLYLRVRDLDVSLQKAESLGAKRILDPQEVPGGSRVVQLVDPQGAMFALNAGPTD